MSGNARLTSRSLQRCNADLRPSFALVVLSPDSVDVVDLSRDRRSFFRRTDEAKGPNSEWEEMRVVP